MLEQSPSAQIREEIRAQGPGSTIFWASTPSNPAPWVDMSGQDPASWHLDDASEPAPDPRVLNHVASLLGDDAVPDEEWNAFKAHEEREDRLAALLTPRTMTDREKRKARDASCIRDTDGFNGPRPVRGPKEIAALTELWERAGQRVEANAAAALGQSYEQIINEAHEEQRCESQAKPNTTTPPAVELTPTRQLRPGLAEVLVRKPTQDELGRWPLPPQVWGL